MSTIPLPDLPRDLVGTRILVAMSGGVDSSVAALLLKARGADLVGVFMRSGVHSDSPEGEHFGCCSVSDAYDARRVSDALGMPFYVLNFREQFERIIDYFVDSYQKGRTPNPCVACNQWLKFGRLYEYAETVGASRIATGHYARVEQAGDRYHLLRGLDADKDQSYVLFSLGQEQLSRALFPCGGYTKPRIRQFAEDAGLAVFNKPDSNEICFVPSNNYRDVLEEQRPGLAKPGPIMDTFGNRVGEHPGYQFYTIGQRKGLGVALGHPVYVVEIQPDTNTVVIGEDDDLHGSSLIADRVNWIVPPPESGSFDGLVKIRYNGGIAPGSVTVTGESTVEVAFDEPVRAITPGQAVVWYDGDVVVGGGWIC